MAVLSITVPDGDVADTLRDRALSLGYLNAKAMVIALIKEQYKIQKRIAAEAAAKTTVQATVADPNVT